MLRLLDGLLAPRARLRVGAGRKKNKMEQITSDLKILAQILRLVCDLSQGGKARVLAALNIALTAEEKQALIDTYGKLLYTPFSPTCLACGHELLSGVDGGAECGECE
jgi:hypothetical protein